MHYSRIIFRPTRVQFKKNSLQVHSATIIDIIASNLYECIVQAGNLQYPDSDHYATFVCYRNYYDVLPSHSNKQDVYRRNLNNVDISNLTNDFTVRDWNKLVYNEPNIDIAVDNLINKTEYLLDIHAPLLRIPNRKLKYCTKPWIDKELQDKIKYKNKLFDIKSNIPTENNKVTFTKYNNYVTTQRRNKKKVT